MADSKRMKLLLLALLKYVAAAAFAATAIYLAWRTNITLEKMQGLLTPTIGVLTLYIAWQQWQTNRQKLSIDLYDRRLHVYREVIKFVDVVIESQTIDVGMAMQMAKDTAEVNFLFSDDEKIKEYLRELRVNAISLAVLQSKIKKHPLPQEDSLPSDDPAFQQNLDKVLELDFWFVRQRDVATKKFMKYLNVSQR